MFSSGGNCLQLMVAIVGLALFIVCVIVAVCVVVTLLLPDNPFIPVQEFSNVVATLV